jgi:putative salt-induced outer membrane protein
VKVPLAQIAREELSTPPRTETQAFTNWIHSVTASLQELANRYHANKVSPEAYHRQRAAILSRAEAQGATGTELAGSAWIALLATPPAPSRSSSPAAGKAGAAQKRWTGEANLGTDLSFGTKNTQLFYGRLKGTYAESKFRNAIDYMFTYGETEGELSANRMDGSMKTDWGITPKFYIYNLGGAGYDEIRKIDRKYELGPGVGYELFRLKRFQLSVEGGVNYQVEDRSTSGNVERFYYRLANLLTWQITPRLTWDEKFEFFPRVQEVEQYRFRLETNLRYTLMGNIALLVTLLDQYDTQPARDVERNDLQIRSSIGVKF